MSVIFLKFTTSLYVREGIKKISCSGKYKKYYLCFFHLSFLYAFPKYLSNRFENIIALCFWDFVWVFKLISEREDDWFYSVMNIVGLSAVPTRCPVRNTRLSLVHSSQPVSDWLEWFKEAGCPHWPTSQRSGNIWTVKGAAGQIRPRCFSKISHPNINLFLWDKVNKSALSVEMCWCYWSHSVNLSNPSKIGNLCANGMADQLNTRHLNLTIFGGKIPGMFSWVLL